MQAHVLAFVSLWGRLLLQISIDTNAGADALDFVPKCTQRYFQALELLWGHLCLFARDQVSIHEQHQELLICFPPPRITITFVGRG